MSTDIANAVGQPRMHHKYYFTFIIFEVEKVLFKVPRHVFEDESELFKDMFALPPGGDRLPEGSSDSEPFVLHDVTVKDFEALLKVLLPDPLKGRTRSIWGWAFFEESSSLNQEGWISVLRLSHKWTFDRLFKLAIQNLEKAKLNPVTEVTIAKTYTITSWLRPAYFSLVTRKEPLTLEEASELGMGTVVKLNLARDFHYRWIIEGEKAEHPQIKSPQRPISDMPYYKGNTKKKTRRSVDTGTTGGGGWGHGSARHQTVSDDDFEPGDKDTKLLDEKEIACLEVAINSVLTELFGLE